VKEDQLVRHCGCRCTEGQWVWDDDKREQRRWVNWVMERVTKVELTFLCSEVEVGWSREGGWWRWYKFNALVSAWEERRRDEVLSEDEPKTMCSSWLNKKETWHSAVAWWRQWEEMRYRGGKRKETIPVKLTRILSRLKNKEKSPDRFSCYKWTMKI
jgi:hypothetical protein